MLSAHAEAKYRSFQAELDSDVFPCLGDADGCHRLMEEISQRRGFQAEATWLAVFQRPGDRRVSFCGTVQGIRDSAGLGGIQNLGVTVEHRGKGIGSALLCRALKGFRKAGLTRAYLEVTAQNAGAVRLYRRFGFKRVRTSYKAVEVAYA